jgi:hypothetical protein
MDFPSSWASDCTLKTEAKALQLIVVILDRQYRSSVISPSGKSIDSGRARQPTY